MPNDTESTLRAFILHAFDLYTQKNVDQFLDCFSPDFSNFFVLNGLLSERRIAAKELQELYDAGLAPNLEVRHLNVRVIGEAALVTAYAAGSIQMNEDTVLQGSWRFTAVLQNTSNHWHIIHNHWSKLVTA